MTPECVRITPFLRFVFLPLATAAFTGFGLAAPAGAQTAGEAPVADPCVAAFGGKTNQNFQMATSFTPGGEAKSGDEARLEGAWNATMWDAVSSLMACVEVSDRVDPNLGGVEEPPVNDGAFAHAFNIPAGLANGTVICTRLRMAGDPAGAATTGEWLSKKACVEVHPEGTEPTPTTTAPPAQTTTTTTRPAAPPTTTATTAPPAVAPPTTSPPAQSAGDQVPAPPLPEGPDQSTVNYGAPEEPPAVKGKSPKPNPISLPILPETGASVDLLAWAGATAVACGLSLIAAGRRRSARR